MSDPVKLVLSKPVMSAGVEFTEIIFREPKGKDLRTLPAAADGMTIGVLMNLAAKLGNVTPEAFDEMAPKDVLKAVALIGPFLQ